MAGGSTAVAATGITDAEAVCRPFSFYKKKYTGN
jgi:hypothetical protein